jgi:hypothetical protein
MTVMRSKVSVIIPSRLQPMPGGDPARLWLERAVSSVFHQRVQNHVELEIVVGIGPGQQLPVRWTNMVVVAAHAASPAFGTNAAVAASTGDVLAFLDEDDYWLPKRLAYGLSRLPDFDLITCSQREVREGQFLQINDYPTPSGWMLRRAAWDRLGPLDDSYRLHHDSEYIGRATAAGLKRLHLVEAEAPARPWLQKVARYSAVASIAEREPLVDRSMSEESLTTSIVRGPARALSLAERRRLLEKYGEAIW